MWNGELVENHLLTYFLRLLHHPPCPRRGCSWRTALQSPPPSLPIRLCPGRLRATVSPRCRPHPCTSGPGCPIGVQAVFSAPTRQTLRRSRAGTSCRREASLRSAFCTMRAPCTGPPALAAFNRATCARPQAKRKEGQRTRSWPGPPASSGRSVAANSAVLVPFVKPSTLRICVPSQDSVEPLAPQGPTSIADGRAASAVGLRFEPPAYLHHIDLRRRMRLFPRPSTGPPRGAWSFLGVSSGGTLYKMSRCLASYTTLCTSPSASVILPHPRVPKVSHTLADVGEFQAPISSNLVPNLADLGQNWPNSLGSKSTKCGRIPPSFGRSQSDVGRTSSIWEKLGPTGGQEWPTLARIWSKKVGPTLTELEQSWSKFGRSSPKFGPDCAKCGRIRSAVVRHSVKQVDNG